MDFLQHVGLPAYHKSIFGNGCRHHQSARPRQSCGDMAMVMVTCKHNEARRVQTFYLNVKVTLSALLAFLTVRDISLNRASVLIYLNTWQRSA